MKQISSFGLSIFLLSVLLTLSCQADQPGSAGQQADVAAARSAIKAFAGELQAELKTAMQAGGPVAAIGVCNTQAMPISERVAAEYGMQLSRVSLKNRNPGNQPNQWQSAVLEEFERRRLAGEDVEKLAWSETVNMGDGADGAREFRFMKAIPTGDICLKCHGSNLSPEVSQALNGLYPDDRATGFQQGDIRGAFVATRQLSESVN